MLTGIIGDIHGNIDALSATLDVFDRLAVKNVFCAGDVVGYGGAPGECIDMLRERNIPCACGNHDAYTTHPDRYNSKNVRTEANKVIEWNRKVLRPDHLDWLSKLPLIVETDKFIVTHASCQPFPQWIYVTNQRNAAMHLLFQPHRLCFNAHCHVPLLAMHKPGHSITLEFFHNLILPKNTNIMIGVGAVGQPRDDDPRACSILYNDVADSATILRVKYDIRAAQKRILDNGLPPSLAKRLETGQ